MPELAVSENSTDHRESDNLLKRFGQGHRERVAAWCAELALALQLRPDETEALQEAALIHDLEDNDAPQSSPSTGSILAHFRRSEAGKEAIHARVASLLTVSDRFDSWTGSALLQSKSPGALLEECSVSCEPYQKAASFLVKRLRRAGREELRLVMPRLPVYPAVAMRLYALLSDIRVSLPLLEQVAKSDQVLAGKLIRASNSAFYSPVVPICSVSKAIGFVGTEDARRILLASALQPLFATETMRQQWEHSLQAAAYAERIAALSHGLDKAEAFLLGLLHDVGRLALSFLPESTVASIQRLCNRGCPAIVAESVVCGLDHAEVGADVLAYWRFPAAALDSVQYHHCPELSSSPMASVLYLVEAWTNREGEPSNDARYKHAMTTLGVDHSALEQARRQPLGALSGL